VSIGNNAAYGTVAVGATAGLILGGRSLRDSVTIQNVHATQILYIGNDASVTTSTGLKIAAGDKHSLETYNGPIYGIASGAATDTRYLEVF
jgi:hypothetical protein